MKECGLPVSCEERPNGAYRDLLTWGRSHKYSHYESLQRPCPAESRDREQTAHYQSKICSSRLEQEALANVFRPLNRVRLAPSRFAHVGKSALQVSLPRLRYDGFLPSAHTLGSRERPCGFSSYRCFDIVGRPHLQIEPCFRRVGSNNQQAPRPHSGSRRSHGLPGGPRKSL